MADKDTNANVTEKNDTRIAASSFSSRDDVSDNNDFDIKEEKRILRKIDLHLIVPLWFLFMSSFVSRINLGNVRLLGLERDLHLKGNDFNVALQVFFATYILFDIPANLLLKRSRPSFFISGMAFCWGIVAMSQGFTTNLGGLIAVRALLGTCESGFTPGAVYLMSMWYQKHEFQLRFNIFWSAGILAGATSGLMAYGLVNMNTLAGLAGWRWVLIIEGLTACTLSLITVWVLADWPHQAKFLTAAERQFWSKRTLNDLGGHAKMDKLTKATILRTIKDWKIWCGALMYMSVGTSGYSTSLFMPSILATLGYSGVQAQVQSIPIWVVATVVCFCVGILSDRVKHRYGFIIAGLTLAMIGYAILLGQGPLPKPGGPPMGLPVRVRYFALYAITSGTYIAQPVVIVWLSNCLGGSTKRSIGSAIQICFGNFSGIIASNIFSPRAAPRNIGPYATIIGLLCLCGFLSTCFAIGLVAENKRRDRGERDHLLQLNEELGDDHPTFRFSV
ncbi:putative transmembrane transporter [Elsinoe ampelina]|uniref:Putative transmembrane transporter n=1 Tax=Elsinoe ampelina TaxID=302913 RepID=A0A6A6GJX7_9PEZI|nr:putative transmembrane transporter [Elsinoe ampelina]